MRKSYGFRTYRVLELALYHRLAALVDGEEKDIPPGKKLATCFRPFLQALAVEARTLLTRTGDL